MGAALGILGLVVVLAGVGLLVKKQLTANGPPVPALAVPAGAGVVDPNAIVKAQSQQVQQQVKQALDAAMQQGQRVDEADKP